MTRRPVAFLLWLCLGCLAGCGDASPGGPSTDTAGEAAGPRLVTLAPALSQMLIELEVGGSIVGVAEFDAAAPEGLPIVGNYQAVDTEALLNARPTHVLMMTGPAGPPARLRELSDEGLFELYSFPFPLSVQDIGRVLHEDTPSLGPAGLGEALGLGARAFEVKLRMLKQLAAIDALTSGKNADDRPAVLLVLGTRPSVMASGPGTVHDELLGFAGGVNAAYDAAVTAPEYDRESLLELSPDVILFLQPNGPAMTPDDPRLEAFAGLPIPAIQDDRVYVLNDPLTLLPSTSVVRTCAAMGKAIHPDLADAIDQVVGDSQIGSADE